MGCIFCLYSREKLNSMNLLLYMAPTAVVFLLPATLIMEENVVGLTLALAREDVRIVWYLLFNSALAYFVNLSNFLVTKHTSALTLQVHSILLSVHVNRASYFNQGELVYLKPAHTLLPHSITAVVGKGKK